MYYPVDILCNPISFTEASIKKKNDVYSKLLPLICEDSANAGPQG